jgi:hypothetical protein
MQSPAIKVYVRNLTCKASGYLFLFQSKKSKGDSPFGMPGTTSTYRFCVKIEDTNLNSSYPLTTQMNYS